MFFRKKSTYYEPHPYRLYQPRSNSPFPYPTNSERLLGTREYGNKNPSKTRVLVLGGSTVEELAYFSNRLNKDPNAHWHSLLEKELNATHAGSGQEFEVLAIAAAGYTSYECLISYITQGRHLKPDIVISYQGVNDVIWSFMANDFKSDYSHVRENNFPRGRTPFRNIHRHDERTSTSADNWKITIDKLATLLSRSLNFSLCIRLLEKFLISVKLIRPNGLIYAISNANYPSACTAFCPSRVSVFIENVKMLDAICKLSGVKLLNITFQYQRVPFVAHILKKSLAKNQVSEVGDFYVRYLELINKELIASGLTTYHIKEGEFQEDDFRDPMHFNESGQKKIALHCAKAVLKLMRP